MSVNSMIAAMGVTLLLATDARAQLPSCGSVDYTNDIYQNGNLRRVWLQANTFREGAWCPLELQTEAWVWGVGPAVVGRGVYSSPVMLGTLVHYWGKWESQGKHWVIFTSFPQTWVYFADSHDETAVNPPDELERVIERAVALAGGPSLDLDDLPPALPGGYADALLPALRERSTMRAGEPLRAAGARAGPEQQAPGRAVTSGCRITRCRGTSAFVRRSPARGEPCIVRYIDEGSSCHRGADGDRRPRAGEIRGLSGTDPHRRVVDSPHAH